MNMSIISIQLKSEDSRFPMNGKLLSISNVHSVGCDSDLLTVKYEDTYYHMQEYNVPMSKVSYFFIS